MPQKTIYILTERIWDSFKNRCESRKESMSGVIALLIDAYTKNPKETIVALQRLKK